LALEATVMRNDMLDLFLCVGAGLDGLCCYFVLDFLCRFSRLKTERWKHVMN